LSTPRKTLGWKKPAKMADQQDEEARTQHARVMGVKPPSPLMTGPQARTDWIQWKEDWEDYALVQDIASKADDVQCALFRIALGTEGKQLLRNQPVPARRGLPMDTGKLDTLIQMMQTAIACVWGGVNDTYEWYVFRTRT